MIPISCKENVSYIDSDGITFTFLPKTPERERRLYAMYEAIKGESLTAQADKSNQFIDEILIGWSDPQGRLPAFPGDNHPSKIWNQEEIGALIGYWNKANSLTVEEKKL